MAREKLPRTYPFTYVDREHARALDRMLSDMRETRRERGAARALVAFPLRLPAASVGARARRRAS